MIGLRRTSRAMRRLLWPGAGSCLPRAGMDARAVAQAPVVVFPTPRPPRRRRTVDHPRTPSHASTRSPRGCHPTRWLPYRTGDRHSLEGRRERLRFDWSSIRRHSRLIPLVTPARRAFASGVATLTCWDRAVPGAGSRLSCVSPAPHRSLLGDWHAGSSSPRPTSPSSPEFVDGDHRPRDRRSRGVSVALLTAGESAAPPRCSGPLIAAAREPFTLRQDGLVLVGRALPHTPRPSATGARQARRQPPASAASATLRDKVPSPRHQRKS